MSVNQVSSENLLQRKRWSTKQLLTEDYCLLFLVAQSFSIWLNHAFDRSLLLAYYLIFWNKNQCRRQTSPKTDEFLRLLYFSRQPADSYQQQLSSGCIKFIAAMPAHLHNSCRLLRDGWQDDTQDVIPRALSFGTLHHCISRSSLRRRQRSSLTETVTTTQCYQQQQPQQWKQQQSRSLVSLSAYAPHDTS